MPETHLLLDHIFIAIILVSSVIEWRWLWPRLLRAIASGNPGARLRYYRVGIIAEWLSMACILVAWMVQGRSWAVFRLGDAPPLRLGLGLLLVGAVTWLLWTQRRAVFARPDTLEKVRQKMGF